MGYSLRAFIGLPQGLRPVADAYAPAVLVTIEQGFCLIPLTDDLFDALADGVPSKDIEPFGFLTTQVEQQVVARIGAGAIGYLEADYFGGTGHQAALLWRGAHRRVWGRGVGAINAMLQQLGVAVERPYTDAFDAIGLGRHRHLEDWLPDQE